MRSIRTTEGGRLIHWFNRMMKYDNLMGSILSSGNLRVAYHPISPTAKYVGSGYTFRNIIGFMPISRLDHFQPNFKSLFCVRMFPDIVTDGLQLVLAIPGGHPARWLTWSSRVLSRFLFNVRSSYYRLDFYYLLRTYLVPGSYNSDLIYSTNLVQCNSTNSIFNQYFYTSWIILLSGSQRGNYHCAEMAIHLIW